VAQLWITPPKVAFSRRFLTSIPSSSPSAEAEPFVSPKKRTRKKTENPIVTGSDSSSWRESRISRTDRIAKTQAIEWYRLTSEEVETLEPDYYQTSRGHTDYLYNHRDIERKAWEKHGGPEGWTLYLNKLRAVYIKRYGSGAKFQAPIFRRSKDRPKIISLSPSLLTKRHVIL